ncbi:hypothetical protein Trisim1_005267 [Trichoderma cf. simile WF8]|uniref:Uncharacterized protein n=1 Tax=Trichoderma guizhouense TaxID=1491466 RepID=A0A1T3CP47_9HYPO|nr:hypothetical protein A0O28_0084890 [Trichoderma guizhouense]
MAVTQLMYHPTVQARVGQVLPPATIEHPATDPTAFYYFATPVLLSATNTVVEGLLQGNRAPTGMPINGGAAIQYTLADLAILAPGTYYLRIDLYGMSAGGANLVAQTNPSLVTVSN